MHGHYLHYIHEHSSTKGTRINMPTTSVDEPSIESLKVPSGERASCSLFCSFQQAAWSSTRFTFHCHQHRKENRTRTEHERNTNGLAKHSSIIHGTANNTKEHNNTNEHSGTRETRRKQSCTRGNKNEHAANTK